MLRKTVFVFGLTFAVPAALLAQQGALEPTLRAMPVAEEKAGLYVRMGDMTDSRTTGKFFAELKIDLKTEGDALSQAFGVIKPVITAAVDDTGRALLKDDKKNEPLFWTFEVLDKKRTSLENQISLLNPLRKATSISFMGYVDVLTPERDPASLYVVKSFIAQAGKPLLPKVFQKTGLEITVMTKPLVEKMKQERERMRAQAEAQKAAGSSAANAGQVMGEAFGKIFESMFSGFFSMGENDLFSLLKIHSGRWPLCKSWTLRAYR